MNRQKPKPDDRSDNVEKLQSMVQNTIENIEAAEETMAFSSPQEKAKIQAKNEKRQHAIEGFKEEIQDESNSTER